MPFLAPIIVGAASTAGAIASTVGATALGAATTVGSAALGTAGAIGGAALGTAGAIGKAAVGTVTGAVGGLGTLARVAKPAAEVFGAVSGVVQSVEQAKAQKKAEEEAQKQAQAQAQIEAQAEAQRQLQREAQKQLPIETMADLMLRQPAAVTGEPTEAVVPKPGIIEQLGPYLPLLAVGLVAILLLRSRK